MIKIAGPFKQILSMDHMPLNGPLKDTDLHIVTDGGVIMEGKNIIKTGHFESLIREYRCPVEEVEHERVLLPGMIDAHTHICYAGSRALDYSRKLEGLTYQAILAAGGGIYSTVDMTRKATFEALKQQTFHRVRNHFSAGITTIEIKSGYGLNMEDELKMLEVIAAIDREHPADLIPTCLAAHVQPNEFDSANAYLNFILSELLPLVGKKRLANRVDIFVEENAFAPEQAFPFLQSARSSGFDLTVHADQFSTGGSRIAAKAGARSADHLEASGPDEIRMLRKHGVIAIVLPGASIGLAMPFAPARDILDEGLCLAIASDWNPGSAPMGDLLLEAALLSNWEKLTTAETLSGLTFRAAAALGLTDRGIVGPHKQADMIAFPTGDYREILYNQGMLKPDMIWKNGKLYINKDPMKL